jgi:predicted NBD/HSP70 family sugar kinase
MAEPQARPAEKIERGSPLWQMLDYLRGNPWSAPSKIARDLGVHRSTPGRTLKKAFPALHESGGAFALRLEKGCLVVIDLGTGHWRVAIDRLTPNLAACDPHWEPANVIDQPEEAIAAAAAYIEGELGDRAREDVAGIVVGLPFPLHDDDRIRHKRLWKTFDPAAAVKAELEWAPEIKLESDVGLGAIAEFDGVRKQGRPSRRGLIYVKWSSRLGAATLLDGRLVRGDGLASSFFHNPIDPSGGCDICERHCTAEFASLASVFDRVVERVGSKAAALREGDAETRAKELYALCQKNDDAAEIVREAARAIGRSLGLAANVTAPNTIVIGGAFTEPAAARWTLACIDEGFSEVVTPEIRRETQISPGQYTGKAAAAGGLVLASEEFVVPFVYDRYVGASRVAAAEQLAEQMAAGPDATPG